MAPLESYVHLRDGISDISKALLAHASHTSQLKIVGRARHLAAAQALMEDEAPLFEELQIFCIDATDPDSQGAFALPFKLSPTNFRHARHLRSLKLEWVHIDIDSPLLRNLKTLSLRYILPGSLPTWSQLIEMLHRMSFLDHLTLEHVFPNVDPSTLPPKPACLPLLDYVSIECMAASQMQTILSHMSFLRPDELQLHWREGDIDYAPIFQTIGVTTHAKCFGNDFEKLSVDLSPSGRSLSLLAFASGGSSIDVAVPNSTGVGETVIIGDFIDLLCLKNITELEVEIDKEWEHDALRLMADKMPFLQDLTVSFFNAFGFFEVLGMKPGIPHAQAYPQICFPNLQAFTFMNSNFLGREEWVEKVAMEVLATRRDQGAALEGLYFNWVDNLSPEMVVRFEGEVEQVEVLHER